MITMDNENGTRKRLWQKLKIKIDNGVSQSSVVYLLVICLLLQVNNGVWYNAPITYWKYTLLLLLLLVTEIKD